MEMETEANIDGISSTSKTEERYDGPLSTLTYKEVQNMAINLNLPGNLKVATAGPWSESSALRLANRAEEGWPGLYRGSKSLNSGLVPPPAVMRMDFRGFLFSCTKWSQLVMLVEARRRGDEKTVADFLNAYKELRNKRRHSTSQVGEPKKRRTYTLTKNKDVFASPKQDIEGAPAATPEGTSYSESCQPLLRNLLQQQQQQQQQAQLQKQQQSQQVQQQLQKQYCQPTVPFTTCTVTTSSQDATFSRATSHCWQPPEQLRPHHQQTTSTIHDTSSPQQPYFQNYQGRDMNAMTRGNNLNYPFYNNNSNNNNNLMMDHDYRNLSPPPPLVPYDPSNYQIDTQPYHYGPRSVQPPLNYGEYSPWQVPEVLPQRMPHHVPFHGSAATLYDVAKHSLGIRYQNPYYNPNSNYNTQEVRRQVLDREATETVYCYRKPICTSTCYRNPFPDVEPEMTTVPFPGDRYSSETIPAGELHGQQYHQQVQQQQPQPPSYFPNFRLNDQLSFPLIYQYLASTEDQLFQRDQEQKPVHDIPSGMVSTSEGQLVAPTIPETSLSTPLSVMEYESKALPQPELDRPRATSTPVKDMDVPQIDESTLELFMSTEDKVPPPQPTRVPCRYEKNGCLMQMSTEQAPQHEAVCEYQDIDCPVTECNWKDRLLSMGKHIRDEHSGNIAAGVECTHTLPVHKLRAEQKVYFIQQSGDRLYLVGIHCHGHLLYASIQYVPEDRADRAGIFRGTLEVVDARGRPLAWRGKVRSLTYPVMSLRTLKQCLTIDPAAIGMHAGASLRIHAAITAEPANVVRRRRKQ